MGSRAQGANPAQLRHPAGRRERKPRIARKRASISRAVTARRSDPDEIAIAGIPTAGDSIRRDASGTRLRPKVVASMLCVTSPSSYRQRRVSLAQAKLTGQPSRQARATCRARMGWHSFPAAGPSGR